MTHRGPDPPRMTGEEFRERLRRIDLSQNRFANHFGVNVRTVLRWADGEQDIPFWVPVALDMIEHIDALEAALEVNGIPDPPVVI